GNHFVKGRNSDEVFIKDRAGLQGEITKARPSLRVWLSQAALPSKDRSLVHAVKCRELVPGHAKEQAGAANDEGDALVDHGLIMSPQRLTPVYAAVLSQRKGGSSKERSFRE